MTIGSLIFMTQVFQETQLMKLCTRHLLHLAGFSRVNSLHFIFRHSAWNNCIFCPLDLISEHLSCWLSSKSYHWQRFWKIKGVWFCYLWNCGRSWEGKGRNERQVPWWLGNFCWPSQAKGSSASPTSSTRYAIYWSWVHNKQDCWMEWFLIFIQFGWRIFSLYLAEPY